MAEEVEKTVAEGIEFPKSKIEGETQARNKPRMESVPDRPQIPRIAQGGIFHNSDLIVETETRLEGV